MFLGQECCPSCHIFSVHPQMFWKILSAAYTIGVTQEVMDTPG